MLMSSMVPGITAFIFIYFDSCFLFVFKPTLPRRKMLVTLCYPLCPGWFNICFLSLLKFSEERIDVCVLQGSVPTPACNP